MLRFMGSQRVGHDRATELNALEFVSGINQKEKIPDEIGHRIGIFYFPWWLGSKESACSAGDTGLIPGLGRFPGRGHGNTLQYSCLEYPMDRGSLADYSPWGHKESDMTEQLNNKNT